MGKCNVRSTMDHTNRNALLPRSNCVVTFVRYVDRACEGRFVLKASYFLFFTRLASESRFLPLFFANFGCSDSEIGALMSITSLTRVFFTPLWTWFADTHSSRRRVLLWLCITTLILFPLNPLVGLVSTPQHQASGLVFGLFMVLRVVNSSLATAQGPLMDALTLESLGAHKEMFGKQRSWGTIGWGIAYLLLGVSTDAFGISWMFIQYVVAGVLLILVIKTSDLGKPAKIQNPTNLGECDDTKVTEERKKSPMSAVLRVPFANLNNFSFFLLTFGWGAGMALLENFLFLFLTKNFHLSNTMCGLAVTVSILPEIPILNFAELFLRRMGPFMMIVVAQLCFVVRVFAYSTITTPWLVIFFELFHGVTFGLHHSAVVHIIAQLGPESMIASLQGLYSMVTFGLGSSVSVIVGGVLIDKYGDRAVFCGYAAMVLGLTSFYFVVGCLKPSHTRQRVHSDAIELK
eukprot:c25888_g1_i1.p1 GENE.c25888_g1_i1~~c25888_g1_i1.p1  ORF type:complete len:461 (-),score=90.13 c25888_g1_i1:39-1421(-)